MNKRLIREICKKIRIHKSLKQHFEESNSICNRLFSTIDFSKYKNIFIYLSSLEKGEVDTWNIISKLVSNNIFVPKIVNNEIRIAKYDKNFIMNKFGILECKDVVEIDIDIAIIPMFSFNRDLYRVGYGGGYYDKFLENINCFKIGLCSDKMRDWIQDDYDISMDIIVTPTKIYSKNDK